MDGVASRQEGQVFVYEGQSSVRRVHVSVVQACLRRSESVVGFRVEVHEDLIGAGEWRVYVENGTLFVMPKDEDKDVLGSSDQVVLVMPRGFDKMRIVDTLSP